MAGSRTLPVRLPAALAQRSDGRPQPRPPPRTAHRSEGSSVWDAFRARHHPHPFLQLDPLYALTDDHISAISDELPKFFGPADAAFERDLARTTGIGFVHGEPIGGSSAGEEVPVGSRQGPEPGGPPPAEEPPTAAGVGEVIVRFMTGRLPIPPAGPRADPNVAPPLRAEWDPATAAGRDAAEAAALGAALRDVHGRPVHEAAWLDAQERAEADATRQKQEAYAMWVVLQPGYQSDVRAVRTRWACTVRRVGQFPGLLPEEEPPAGHGRPAVGPAGRRAFAEFYRRWGLERMQSWDLPVPLDPRPVIAMEGRWPYDARTGVSVFLPWYILNGTQFDVSALVKRIRVGGVPPHLAGWFGRGSKVGARFEGEIALRQKFWLHRTYSLVLFRRYPAACRRNQERLDAALAGVLRRGEDLVKKLRQSLARGLKKAGYE